MSYYAGYAADLTDTFDRSFPSAVTVLTLRIEELKERLAELIHTDEGDYSSFCRYDELRSILPEDIFTVGEAEAALELAESDLENEVGCEAEESAGMYGYMSDAADTERTGHHASEYAGRSFLVA